MKILIYGAGAVGGYFGARLLEAGVPVTFLSRGPHLTALQQNGIRLDSVDGHFDAPVRAVGSLAEAMASGPPADLVLLCVKGHDTQKAAADLAAHLPATTPVMALQNGIGHLEVLAHHLGPKQVIAASVFIGAQVSAPGTIRHTGAGFIRAGHDPQGHRKNVTRIIDFMAANGVNISESENIRKEMWKKLLWNVGFNGPSALTGASVGQMTQKSGCAWLIRGLIAEAVTVGQGVGIALKDSLVETTFGHTKGLDDFKTSMLQDVEAGRSIENDAFYGYLLTEGENCQVDTPLIRMVHDALSLRFE